MIMDERTEFADALALSTAGTGTTNLGDVIDTENVRNLGEGKQMYLVIQVDTDVTTATSATVQFALVSDSVAPPLTNGTQTTHVLSAALDTGALTAGTNVLTVAIPREGGTPYERYLGVQQIIAGAALTGGAVNAFLTMDPPSWKAYPDAQN